MAAQKNRTQRRAARTKQAQARSRSTGRGRAGETVWQRRARHRRWMVIGAVGVLVLALGGGVAALVATSGGNGKPSTSGKRPPTVLVPHTLLQLSAASSVVEGSGTGYVTDDTRDVVEKFDPATGKVEATTKVPGRPVAMVLTGSDLWLAEMVTNTVVEVDAASLQVVRSIPVPAGPSGLAVLGNDVWVASVIDKSVTPIDTNTGTAGTTVGVLAGAVRVAGGFGALWVTGTTDLLTRIVPSSTGGAPAQTVIKVGQIPIGVTTGAGQVWVANSGSGTVDEVEPSTLLVSTLENIGRDPVAVAVAAQRVWVGFGTTMSLRYIIQAPESEQLNLHMTPRALIGVGAGVWVAGSNPGGVLDVTAPRAPPITH